MTLKSMLSAQAERGLAMRGYSKRRIDQAKRQGRLWLDARAVAVTRGGGLFAGRTVLWTQVADGSAELSAIEVPRAGAGEVTVEVEVSTISPGTERAQYLRLPNAQPAMPYRPGYSVAGRVVAVGRDVADVAVGQRVAVSEVPHASVATVAAERVFAVPDGVSTVEAAAVHLGVISGYGVTRSDVRPGEPVCVIGAGPIGALAARLARARGCGPLTVVATSRRREALARAGGAETFLVAGEDDDAIAVCAAPVVIEATGDPAALATAIQAAADGARIVLLGSARGVTPDIGYAAVRAKGLKLIGAHVRTLAADGRRREAEQYLEALAAGRLSTADLFDTAADPREAGLFYRALARRPLLAAAHFDWRRLPTDVRARKVPLATLPDLSARGVDFVGPALRSERTPLHRNGHLPPAGELRIGLLGCGDIGIQNAAAVAAAPNARLVACCDPQRALAEGVAVQHGIPAVTSTEALVERDDVDAVLICAPHHLHAPLAIQAAEAGRHVIVEKPPANDLADAVRMTQAAEAAGVRLSVCFPQRYDPDVVTARRLIEAGAIGTFGGAFVKQFMDRSPAYWKGGFTGRSVSDWRASRAKAGGGVLIMNLSHYLDLTRLLCGREVEAVSAFASASEQSDGEVEDTITVSLQFEGGPVGTVLGCSAIRGARSDEMRIWGSDGHVEIAPTARVYTLSQVDGLPTTRWSDLGPAAPANIRAEYVTRFATAVAHDVDHDVSPADALAVQAVIAAVYRSVDTGTIVRPGAMLAEAGA